MDRIPPPLVSVIIAAYNPGSRLGEALRSLDKQTFRSFETIVVDDGSTQDLSNQVSGDVILLRNDQNRGPAAARNLGIGRARGKYIAVLDADDLWMPSRLEVAVGLLEDDPSLGFISTDSYLMFGDAISDRTWFSTNMTAISEEPAQVRIFRSNFLSSQAIYRKELFDKHGLYDESLRVGEDWDRAIAFLVAGEKLHLIADPLAVYRVTPDSASRDQRAAAGSRIRILERWLRGPLSEAQTEAASVSLQGAKWDLAKLDLEERGASDLLRVLARDSHGAMRAKALAALTAPRLFLAVRKIRQRFLESRGGNWVLHEAMEALDRGARDEARRSMEAVILFGFPLRIRALAALWLVIPPARGYAEARLRVDRLVVSMTRRISD